MYQVSAPANLMLFGEYAVLNGCPALVCAVNQRLRVTLQPNPSNNLNIQSRLGNYQGSIDSLNPDPIFDYCLNLCKEFNLPSGFDLQIDSAICHKKGLGSSAALVAALTVALSQWLNTDLSTHALWEKGIKAIRKTQGDASGADLAASLMGGLLSFQNSPLTAVKIKPDPPIAAIYSGSKLSTKDAILAYQNSTIPGMKALIDQSSKFITPMLTRAFMTNNLKAAGELMNAGHGLLSALGVSSPVLDALAWILRAQPSITGAKISGSGLGDCVIGIGQSDDLKLPTALINQGCEVLPLRIDSVGWRNEHE